MEHTSSATLSALPGALSSARSGANCYTTKGWIQQVEAVDLEIVQLAMLCKVKLLSSGVMEQVLDNNATVAGNDNPRAFTKLRGLLFLHFEIEQRLTGCCATAAHAKALVRLVQDSLARRLGDKVNVLR